MQKTSVKISVSFFAGGTEDVREYEIKFVSNRVGEMFGELSQKYSEVERIFKEVAELKKASLHLRGESLKEMQAKIAERMAKVEALNDSSVFDGSMFPIIKHLLESNGYSADRDEWYNNTDQAEVLGFITSAVMKDKIGGAPKKK